MRNYLNEGERAACKRSDLRFLPLLLLALSSFACHPWGSFDNPGDPKAANYQGYETVSSPADIRIVSPASGASLSGVYVTATKLAGAAAYGIKIAASEAGVDSEPLFSKTDYALNVMDLSDSGIRNSTTYYCRVGAAPPSTTVAWSPVSSFTTTSTAIPPASNADLSGITLSAGTLAPAFDPATLLYTVCVAETVTSITISGTKANAYATVSPPVTLSDLVGGIAQTATITVTAENGETKTYTVLVIRATVYDITITTSFNTLAPNGYLYVFLFDNATWSTIADNSIYLDASGHSSTAFSGITDPSGEEQDLGMYVYNQAWEYVAYIEIPIRGVISGSQTVSIYDNKSFTTSW
jgi:hypothetical protein